MIGNDVVDLGDAETQIGAQHPSFDNRVFTQDERERIAVSESPRHERWLLWAAKEAAYKALRRLDPGFVFSPRNLPVALDAEGNGALRAGGETLRLQTQVSEERVTALARRARLPRTAITEFAFPASGKRQTLRDAIGARLGAEARRRGIANGEPRLEREGRIPVLCVGAMHFPVSIAHHGRFACVAVLWDCDEC